MVFCAIVVEKIMSRYLLIEIDQDQAPKQTEDERVAEVLAMATKCCEDSDVPEFCLGLCSPTDAMSRSILGDSLNACAKYKTSIERCFQPVIQEILNQEGKEGQAELAKLGARFGAEPKTRPAKRLGCDERNCDGDEDCGINGVCCFKNPVGCCMNIICSF